MRKSLYIIVLGVGLLSCGTRQNPTKVVAAPGKPFPAPKNVAVKPITPTKPAIQHDYRADFYTQNIGDISRNDNTVSYGSIVSANPLGYRVTKNFFPAVAQNFRQKYLILHYTALDDDKSVSVLTHQTVSVHYIVNNLGDNEIYQIVDENKRAYHAGISHWRSDNNLNDTSIGIEIVNPGFTSDASGSKIFVAYPDAQFRKVAALAKDITARYNIPATNVLAHSDIAPTRKQDPGPLFPWKRLYNEYQIGMWYDDATMQNILSQLSATDFLSQSATPQFIFNIQNSLQKFGYDINPTGNWDKESSKVVEAFQYHFRPEKYDGVVDAETWAILQALLQKYPTK